jgi:hypothetical protein
MQWEARYNDETTLPQYNDDGSENRYADIDRARLASFALLADNLTVIEVHLDPGARLIFRRRVAQAPGGETTCVHLVGWQRTIAGQNVQSILYVMPDGDIHMAGAWRDDHPWFYAAQSVTCEQEEV